MPLVRAAVLVLAGAPALAQTVPTEAEVRAAFADPAPATEATVTLDNGAYAAILSARVGRSEGGVATFDYAAVTDADRAALEGYIDMLEAVDPLSLTRDQQIAYWVNLYNSVTLEVVLDHMPVDSIRDIMLDPMTGRGTDAGFFAALASAFSGGGPWDAPLAQVNGLSLTLNDIEHQILRSWGEPRIHYAVNCASYGCPDLRAEPWTAEGLDAALDAAAVDFLNHPRGIAADADGALTASSIFDWFQEDFDSTEQGVIDHAMSFATGGLADALAASTSIADFEYDWSLNSPAEVAEVETRL